MTYYYQYPWTRVGSEYVEPTFTEAADVSFIINIHIYIQG